MMTCGSRYLDILYKKSVRGNTLQVTRCAHLFEKPIYVLPAVCRKQLCNCIQEGKAQSLRTIQVTLAQPFIGAYGSIHCVDKFKYILLRPLACMIKPECI